MNNAIRILLAVAVLTGIRSVPAAGRQTVNRYDEDSTPVVVSKGNWIIGGQATFSAHENSNYSLAFIRGVNSAGFRVSAAPEFCCAVMDNLAVGAKLSYGRTMLSVADGSAEVATLSVSVKDYFTESQNAALTAFVRYYIPIIESGKLAFHVDAGLRGLYGQGKRTDEKTGNVVGTWESRWSASLIVNPGITAFISPKVALFASLGIAGLSYGNVDQVHNQVSEGGVNAFKANFMLDPTELSIGIDFYLGKR